MNFLSSPVQSYSYETFDDAFFELPKEMDFEVNDELKDSFSYSVDDDDDLNDGMYGVWNAKHPWSVNNNAASIYNSNLHLDFIGGDPESAIMVNPNIVIPSGFQFDEETVKINEEEKEENFSSLMTSTKADLENEDSPTVQVKKIKSKYLSLKENILDSEECSRTSLKNGIRILKPTVVEPNIPTIFNSNQTKNDNGNSRSKNTLNKSNGNIYCQDGFYPKPAFSYSCLIAMALKNSEHGCLPVAEIYNFMCNHFPYFKTAPNGWKNSVRHNLSLNKCFEKIEKRAGSTQRKGCLWALNPNKAAKLEEEVQKCTKKDVTAIKRAMEYPEHLELLEKGELKSLYDTDQGLDEDDDDEDLDMNEVEELTRCEDDIMDERLSESEDQDGKPTENESEQYPVLNVADTQDLPEFNIEVDGSIYEELIGSINNEQLFTIDSSVNSRKTPGKKIKKYFIQVNGNTEKDSSCQSKNNDPEVFDHYDINNLLRVEHENKLGTSKKTPQRFNRRICPTSRIKQIKFKTWN